MIVSRFRCNPASDVLVNLMNRTPSSCLKSANVFDQPQCCHGWDGRLIFMLLHKLAAVTREWGDIPFLWTIGRFQWDHPAGDTVRLDDGLRFCCNWMWLHACLCTKVVEMFCRNVPILVCEQSNVPVCALLDWTTSIRYSTFSTAFCIFTWLLIGGKFEVSACCGA